MDLALYSQSPAGVALMVAGELDMYTPSMVKPHIHLQNNKTFCQMRPHSGFLTEFFLRMMAGQKSNFT